MLAPDCGAGAGCAAGIKRQTRKPAMAKTTMAIITIRPVLLLSSWTSRIMSVIRIIS